MQILSIQTSRKILKHRNDLWYIAATSVIFQHNIFVCIHKVLGLKGLIPFKHICICPEIWKKVWFEGPMQKFYYRKNEMFPLFRSFE